MSDFKPHPYTFRLIDSFDCPMNVNQKLQEKIIAHCPPFHILLDHTIAVLWMLFSSGKQCNLRSSQIGWALKFLEGMHNEFRIKYYSEDVLKAIQCLESALVNCISSEDRSRETAMREQSSIGSRDYYRLSSIEDANSVDGSVLRPSIQSAAFREIDMNENESLSLFLRDMLD